MANDPFEALRNETITLVKQTGDQIENIRATMGTGNKTITFASEDLQVDDGDTILRHLPGDRIEEYRVIDSGFSPEFHGIPAHYECEVEKTTALRPSSNQDSVVYNVTISGTNSRFNLHSYDLSTNLVDVDPDRLFKELRGAVARDVEDEIKQQEILRQVSELKKTRGTPQFVEVYQQFISSTADHMTIIAPFIPALTQMLSG
jgi:hypothetical protein